MFIFSLLDWGDKPDWKAEDTLDCSLYVYLPTRGFWTRLVNGLRYIFGFKSRYGDFDEILVGYEEAGRVLEGLNRFRTVLDERRRARSQRHDPDGDQGTTTGDR